MIVVGAVGKGGAELEWSQDDVPFVRVWAPGSGWGISKIKNDLTDIHEDDLTGQPILDQNGQTEPNDGTSFSAPAVAGLAAYFRGIAADDAGSILSKKLEDPYNVVSQRYTPSWTPLPKTPRPSVASKTHPMTSRMPSRLIPHLGSEYSTG